MDAWSIVLLALVAIVVLDCTVGRWALQFTTTFKATEIPGRQVGSGTVLIHFPGTIMDGQDGIKELLPSLLDNASVLVEISYGFWRFFPEEVARKAAAAIGPPSKERTNITPIASSMGGAVCANTVGILINEYGWDQSDFNAVILAETPLDERSYEEPGRTQSQRLKLVPAGPVLSLLIGLALRAFYVGPKAANIEASTRKEVAFIEREAIRRLSRFKFSAICDQQRFLNNLRIEWMWKLEGIRVVYLVCERDNVTVKQPEAYRDIGIYLIDSVGTTFEWLAVDSPHCGYLERSRTWNRVFELVLKRVAAHQPVGTQLVRSF